MTFMMLIVAILFVFVFYTLWQGLREEKKIDKAKKKLKSVESDLDVQKIETYTEKLKAKIKAKIKK
jgi:uncharacterized protein YoxC